MKNRAARSRLSAKRKPFGSVSAEYLDCLPDDLTAIGGVGLFAE